MIEEMITDFEKIKRIFGRHTFDNLAECINKVINEFKLKNKVTLIVTDNAANFVKAFRCAAHTLNFIATVDANDAEKDAAYKAISEKVFSKFQAIFNKQNQLVLSPEKIKDHLGRYIITPNATSKNENGDTKYDAKVLLKKMLKKETGYLCLFWNDILQHCNKVSIDLQSKSNNILKAVNLLKSLKNVISSLKDSNMVYECRVGKFCSQISIIYKDENKRKIIKKFPDELDKRINAYSVVVENFLFLTRLHVESTIDVEESVNKFISVYKNGVDDSIKAFSKLARIKNKNRSSQTQDNLSSLMILSTENNVLQNLSFDKTLEIFATQKARKKTFA
ncbi:hypothetical protein QTP88_007164 [Uroleucon formosanum]